MPEKFNDNFEHGIDLSGVIVLDAQTLDGKLRVTSFATHYTDLIHIYTGWLHRNELCEADMWYADIYDMLDGHRVCKLIANPDCSIEIVPTPDAPIQRERHRFRLIEVLRRKIKSN